MSVVFTTLLVALYYLTKEIIEILLIEKFQVTLK